MASESSMRSRVVRALRPLGAFAVENPLWPGTPDVSHALGWVELKSEDAWPAGSSTNLAVRHFTPAQRLWHARWRDAGGASMVVLRVGRKDWLALDGATAAGMLGRARRIELFEGAFESWTETPTDQEMERCIRQHAAWRATNGQRAASQRDPSGDAPA